MKRLEQKTKKNLTVFLILGITTLVFTFLVKSFDVKEIGANNSSVGFAGLNSLFMHSEMNHFFYKFTDLLGILFGIVVLFYAFIGLKQLISRKSLKKVDREIILLGLFYIVVAIVYLIFGKAAINYRPVLINGELEASYPSSHTLFAFTICASAIIVNYRLFMKERWARIMNILIIILAILIIVGRLLSGVHWFTDILGGLLIAGTLIAGFRLILDTKFLTFRAD